jgi:hypothetical protein
MMQFTDDRYSGNAANPLYGLSRQRIPLQSQVCASPIAEIGVGNKKDFYETAAVRPI